MAFVAFVSSVVLDRVIRVDSWFSHYPYPEIAERSSQKMIFHPQISQIYTDFRNRSQAVLVAGRSLHASRYRYDQTPDGRKGTQGSDRIDKINKIIPEEFCRFYPRDSVASVSSEPSSTD